MRSSKVCFVCLLTTTVKVIVMTPQQNKSAVNITLRRKKNEGVRICKASLSRFGIFQSSHEPHLRERWKLCIREQAWCCGTAVYVAELLRRTWASHLLAYLYSSSQPDEVIIRAHHVNGPIVAFVVVMLLCSASSKGTADGRTLKRNSMAIREIREMSNKNYLPKKLTKNLRKAKLTKKTYEKLSLISFINFFH